MVFFLQGWLLRLWCRVQKSTPFQSPGLLRLRPQGEGTDRPSWVFVELLWLILTLLTVICSHQLKGTIHVHSNFWHLRSPEGSSIEESIEEEAGQVPFLRENITWVNFFHLCGFYTFWTTPLIGAGYFGHALKQQQGPVSKR